MLGLTTAILLLAQTPQASIAGVVRDAESGACLATPWFEVEIRRSAPSVEIRVGGQVVFRKESSRIVTSALRLKTGATGVTSSTLKGSS